MTLYNNFLLKRGVGLFSRVGLISGDYGSNLKRVVVVVCIFKMLYSYFTCDLSLLMFSRKFCFHTTDRRCW